MPNRPPRGCPRPGCPGVLRVGAGCTVCGQRKQSTRSTPMRYGRAWDQLAKQYRTEHPRCECRGCPSRRCCHGQGPTRHVHHRIALRDGGALLDEANLIGLCHNCHSIRTAAEVRARRTRTGR